MPKKFVGENSKAAAARARKEAVKKDVADKKKKAEEDEYWRDDDKTNARKQQRKEEMERKRQEAVQRKQENRQAHDEEMKELAGKAASSSAKLTRATIEATKHLERERQKEEEQERLLKEKKIDVGTEHVEENVNKLEVDGDTARSVTEAIAVLSTEDPTVDRHPEKRLKAAYLAFEERTMPRLKEEHPTFRLSQLRQVLKKEWQKSPENPLNQRIMNIIS